MFELRCHYDGEDQKELILQASEKALKDIYYRCNEASFSFETYTTKLKEAFENQARYDQALTNRAQVDHMIDHIVIPTTAPIRFQIAVQQVRTFKSSTYDTLNKAAAYLRGQIVDIFPITDSTKKMRAINSASGSAKIEERDGKQFVAGVDVSDKTRRFSKDEWQKLREAEFILIILNEKRLQYKRKVSAAAKESAKSAKSEVPDVISLSNKQVANIAAAYAARPTSSNPSGAPRAGANVSATQQSNHNASSSDTVTSTITYDGSTWTVNRSASAVKIISRSYRSEAWRQIASMESKFKASTITTPMPSESDNHADTHCFGANFLILNFTNYFCTVTPFLDDLDTADEIPIGQGATAWDAPTGLTYIMVFGQGLCLHQFQHLHHQFLILNLIPQVKLI